MASADIGHVVKDIDRRLTNVEQILPTLATKADLDTAIAKAVEPLATKAELAAAIEPLATKSELRAELRAAMDEVSDTTRRHFDVVAERLKEDIKVIADGHAALSQQMAELKTELKSDIAKLDARVTRLQAAR